MVKIFVGNLEPGADSGSLRKLFERFGGVSECDVIKNYGFVHMDLEEEAEAAIAALHGYEYMGSKMNVEMSHGKRGGRGGGRGGRGGGFRGRGDGGGFRGRGRGGFDRGRGRGRGRDDRGDRNGYGSYGRGPSYDDGYDRPSYDRPRYSPYERPSYSREGASEYSRAVTYPGLSARSYDYDYERAYSRAAAAYDYPPRSSAYEDRLAAADPYSRSALYARAARAAISERTDPYGRPGPEYYQARSSGYASSRDAAPSYGSRDVGY